MPASFALTSTILAASLPPRSIFPPLPLPPPRTATQLIRSLIKKPQTSATSVVALVYDVTKRESFDHLEHWAETVRANLTISSNSARQAPILPLPGVVIANKTDLEERTVVKSRIF